MMLLSLLLANLDAVPPPGTDAWLRVVLYLVGIFFALLAGIEKVKAVFGRTPPLSVELKERQAESEKEIKERQTHAEEQRALLHQKVDNLAAQFEKGREEDRKALYNKINASSKDLSDKIESDGRQTDETIKTMAVQIAKMEQLTETHTQQLSHMAHTQERILERLPRKNS